MATNYSTQGVIGPNFDVTSTDAKFKLGTRVIGANGQVWVYVQANNAITQFNVVCIDKDYQATKSTVALLTAGAILGVAQIAFADNDFGWVAINGTDLTALVDGTTDVDPGESIALSTTAGLLAVFTSTTQTKLCGVTTLTTASGTSVTTEVIFSNPSVAFPTGS